MASASSLVFPAGTVRILIVDDHPLVREGVRALLSAAGWDVCGEAENGREAVEKVRDLKPDLVILDINMPVMNGLEAVREIRRIAPATKILILTLYKSPHAEIAAQEAGADAVVEKLEAGNLLTITVERLVGNRFRS